MKKNGGKYMDNFSLEMSLPTNKIKTGKNNVLSTTISVQLIHVY